jgi:hypothetical protein
VFFVAAVCVCSELFLQSAVPEVIDYMDEYYLSKEDWDTIVELGVGPANSEFIMKKISTATKSGFTRRSVLSENLRKFLSKLSVA